MQATRIHGWDQAAIYRGRRPGSLRVVVICRYCGLLTTASSGSSPIRPGPCDGERPRPAPVVWATRRYEPTARYHWLLRAR